MKQFNRLHYFQLFFTYLLIGIILVGHNLETLMY